MRKSILPCLAITFSVFLNAAPSAKGPDSGSLTNAPVIQVPRDAPEIHDVFASGKMVPEISTDDLPPFTQAADGTKFMLIRFRSEGASAVRLLFRSVHLGSTRLFLYGVDGDGAATVVHGPFTSAGPLQTGEFWSPAIAGDQVVVEFQVDSDAPAQLPFSVAEISSVDASLVADTNAVRDSSGDAVRTSKYRGLTLTHDVRDGIAVYENDILLGRADDLAPADASTSKNHEHDGVGVSVPQSLWPNGVVPYAIDPSLPNPARITAAVAAWNNALGGRVRIIPRTTEANYIMYYRSANVYNCSSPVGYIGFGPQYTMLGDGCGTGNAIHETGHQLGLWHEHTRADRNSHVVVHYENMDPNATYNFNQNTWNSQDLGAYDFDSVMHYPSWAFSINGQPTIVTIPAGIPIGQRDHVSSGDANAILQLYGGVPAAPAAPIIQQVTVTINGNPSGTQVVVDGTAMTTPVSLQWTVGSTHTISATDQYPAAGSLAEFWAWSDGGAATHTVTANTGTTVFTANFLMAYSLTTSAAPAGTGAVYANVGGTMFIANSVIVLTATPAPGYCFSSWSGLLAGSPAQVSVTLNRPVTATANFVACAPPPVVTQPAFTPIRVNAGGPAVYDAKGQLWSGDYGFDSGYTYAWNASISNTDTPALYVSERWSNAPLTYSFAVPNGTYQVNLKFAEIWFVRPGYRIFNVQINGQTVLTNFDPAAAAGGSLAAVDRSFTIAAVNGRISITFVPVVSNPKISAIEITQ